MKRNGFYLQFAEGCAFSMSLLTGNRRRNSEYKDAQVDCAKVTSLFRGTLVLIDHQTMRWLVSRSPDSAGIY